MKRLLFYCQHILGIGHLVRSTEIVRGMTDDFEIYFVNGGEVVEGLQPPQGVEMINLPPLKTDTEFRELELPTGFDTLEAVFEWRKGELLALFDRVQPDVLMVELFPFGRRRFSTELIPLLERANAAGTQVVCSLRDIVVTKQDQARHEEKICKLINRHFDLVLIHGDPRFIALERSFSRMADLNCPVHYTGYVVQAPAAAQPDPVLDAFLKTDRPLIVTSVGGGRFGHELLEAVAAASRALAQQIAHQIVLFTGPFSPPEVADRLQSIAQDCPNLTIERYTPNLVNWLQRADLSISMAGYNTTMNVLTTAVRSLLLPFTGNDDQEQMIRCQRLEELGVARMIRPADLSTDGFVELILTTINQAPAPIAFDLSGVETTARLVRSQVQRSSKAAIAV